MLYNKLFVLLFTNVIIINNNSIIITIYVYLLRVS